MQKNLQLVTCIGVLLTLAMVSYIFIDYYKIKQRLIAEEKQEFTIGKVETSIGNTSSMIKSENYFYASQGYMIGKFIKKNISNANVLLITNEGFKKSKRETAFIEAVKDGMGSESVKAVALTLLNPPKRPKGMPEDMPMMPITEMMTSKDFDFTIAANSGQNVIVSILGLPRDAVKMKLWKMPAGTRPKLILIDDGIGASIKLAPAISHGMISAVVTISPKAKFYDKDVPSSLEDAFKKRYILIDKSNLKDNKKSLL